VIDTDARTHVASVGRYYRVRARPSREAGGTPRAVLMKRRDMIRHGHQHDLVAYGRAAVISQGRADELLRYCSPVIA
jgi:hypothetical protein